MDNLNKEESDISQIIQPTKNRFSISNETSDNHCSSSKLILKNFNYTEIIPGKNKNITKNRNSKFKLDQSKLDKVQKHFSKPNVYSTLKYMQKLNHISNIRSPKRRSSIKTLEKDIQQKIIDISMKIELEDNILGETLCENMINEQNNKINLSAFIRKKISTESDIENSSFLSKRMINKNRRHKSYTGANTKFEQLPDGVSPHNNKSYSLFKKNKKNKKKKNPNKFRRLFQKKMVYDSFDSEEILDELDNFYISPDNNFIRLIDLLVIFSSLFNIIYSPFNLTNIKCFCTYELKLVNYIYYFIDFLYIIDLILSFFRAYRNFEFKIISNNKRIIKHYILGQFFLDLLQAIPFYSYICFICSLRSNCICSNYNMSSVDMILILCCSLKQLKLFKILNIRKNSIYYEATIIVSRNDCLEAIFNFFINLIVYSYAFYFFVCVHIFIGKNSFPNWIVKYNLQDKNNYLIFLTSFYYLITTMTTVGYGDYTCSSSFSEMIFEIILLSIGITAYSWIVSSIGNYVKNESYASMIYNKDEAILEDIRITYPNMPFNLYKNIFRHLNATKIRQKQCDSNLLINSLPYSLKNKLLLTIHKQTIQNFKIFKGYQNTNFALRLLKNLIPLYSKKNALLIREGQLIENIIFVKEGRLCLEALIDIAEPHKSVNQYLYKKFIDIDEDVIIVSNYETSLYASKLNNNYQNVFNRAKTELDSIINNKVKSDLVSSINESNIGKELGKWDFGGDIFEEDNYQFINIINISKNESFGDVYMFLCKPSPLCLRVKSKVAELMVLRKYDAIDISLKYPNIWSKIFKKSYRNMLSIKTITIHKIKHYWKNLGKTLTRKSKVKTVQIVDTPVHDNTNTFEENKIEENKEEEDKKEENKMETPKLIPIIKINDQEVTPKNIRTTINSKCVKSNINTKTISFSHKMLTNLVSTNNTSIPSFQKNLLSETNQYISFARKSSKKVSSKNNNMYIENLSKQSKTSSYAGSNSKKSQNLSTFARNKNILNLRIDYLSKLNKKITKLKKAKHHYKDLCKQLLNEQKKQKKNINNDSDSNIDSDSDSDRDNVNDNNNENMNMTFESVDKKYSSFEGNYSNTQSSLKQFKNDLKKETPEISISISSQSSSSTNNSISIYKDSLSISSQINLTFFSKYKNLEQFTLGEYSKNRNLRIATQKFIQYYLSKIHKLKEDKTLEPLITKKSINSLLIDFPTSPYHAQEKKLKKIMSKYSYTNRTSKRIFSDRKYHMNTDETRNSLCFIRKNKVSNYNKKNTLRRYIIIKTNSSLDSVKKRSSNAFRNVNISACSSFRKEKIEINKINKIKTKNEYEKEIEFNENSERKSSQIGSLKIKVECKELKFEK